MPSVLKTPNNFFVAKKGCSFFTLIAQGTDCQRVSNEPCFLPMVPGGGSFRRQWAGFDPVFRAIQSNHTTAVLHDCALQLHKCLRNPIPKKACRLHIGLKKKPFLVFFLNGVKR